jgi:hypothetical protein
VVEDEMEEVMPYDAYGEVDDAYDEEFEVEMVIVVGKEEEDNEMEYHDYTQMLLVLNYWEMDMVEMIYLMKVLYYILNH